MLTRAVVRVQADVHNQVNRGDSLSHRPYLLRNCLIPPDALPLSPTDANEKGRFSVLRFVTMDAVMNISRCRRPQTMGSYDFSLLSLIAAS
jgi:hypothetical protein